MKDEHPQPLSFATRVIAIATITITIAAAVIAALVLATEIFLTLCLAILFGIFLTKLSSLCADRCSLSYHWSLGIVTTIVVLLMFGSFAFLAMQIGGRVSKASDQLGKSQQRLQAMVEQNPTLKNIVSTTPYVKQLISSDSQAGGRANTPDESRSSNGDSDSSQQQQSTSESEDEGDPRSPPGRASNATESSGQQDSEASDSNETSPGAQQSDSNQPASGDQSASIPGLRSGAKKVVEVVLGIFKTTFGLIVNSVLIFFVGLFLAVAPEQSRDGIVLLFPKNRSQRVREILDKIGDMLWNWLQGRFMSMAITGVGAALLLLVLGVPLAGTIGIATALLTFIPNIGGLIALGLAMLVALPQGMTAVGFVFGGYIVLQLIESYIATPLIQQGKAELPPALLIAFQAVMGVIFGFLGAAVASPMLAAAKVAVEEAYVKDVLKKDSSEST